MIINVSGTHGSGKSTLVGMIKDLFEVADPIQYSPPKKKPYGYLCRGGEHGLQETYILGSYETPTGGCDTISKVEDMYETIRINAFDRHVLFEGILAQHSTSRYLEVAKQFKTVSIVLATPVDVAIASVMERRAERGNDKEFNPSNVHKEWKAVESRRKRLVEAGLEVHLLDREPAFAKVLELLQTRP
jgi:hypothetical protein